MTEIIVTQADRKAAASVAALDAARGDAEPDCAVDAWLAECTDGRVSDHTIKMLKTFSMWAHAHPPRGDQVARFVAHMKTLQPDEDVAECPATWGDFLQILEVEAEAWEPFNG